MNDYLNHLYAKIEIKKRYLIACILIFANLSVAYAQNDKISVNVKNVTLKEFLSTVESKSPYTFIYRDAMLTGKSNVTINAENSTVKQVLERVLSAANLTYTLDGKSIYIKDRPIVAKKVIRGQVKDTKGESLIGVSVVDKNLATNGASTDLDGNFELTIEGNGSIIVSYIGYTTQTIDVTGKDNINIILSEDAKLLDEVVIVGYGVEKKVNLTGAISNIKTDNIESIPVANLSNALAGRAPGAKITGSSGMVGANSSIRIRGSLGEPLYVIDGVISNKRSFDALSASEVDQISFLKDAATASVYGSTAGNGVILVTTRRGSLANSKPKFTYQGTYSFSNPTKELMTDRFTATDELVYQNRVAEFQGRELPNGEEEFAYFKNRDYNINDWIWQTPWNTEHTLTVDGGSENIQYYMLGSFMADEGSYKNLSSNKFNLRSNVTAKLSKYIKMNLNVGASMRTMDRFYWPSTGTDDYNAGDIYRSTFNSPRTYPFYVQKDGTPAKPGQITAYPLYPQYSGWTGWNAVDQVVGDRYMKSRERNLKGILTFDIDLGFITKGLSTKITGSYDSFDKKWKNYLTYQKNYKFQTESGQSNRFLPGPIDENQYKIYNFNVTKGEQLKYQTQLLWEQQFNWYIDYNNTFGKHEVSATGVFEQRSTGGEWVSAAMYDPLTQYDQSFVFPSAAEKREASAGEYTGGRMGWIGRLKYIYDQRYIAEVVFRYDGNDNFSKSERWGFFPSISAAWRLREESFMEGTHDWLSDLKLRVSYGTTGISNDVNGNSIARFSYIDKYNAGSSYMFGNSLYSGIKQGAIPNPNVTWATSTTINGGLDFGFLNHRLNGTIDAFYKKESDILGARTVSLPTSYGQSLAPENYAERSWRGAELTINWSDRAMGGDLKYSTYVNLGYSKDRWDVLDQSASYATGNLKDLSIIGMSRNRQLGYIAEGIIRTQEELDALLDAGFTQFGRKPYLGAIKFKDTRGDGYALGADGKIDSNDWYNLLSENTSPRFDYGFGGEISYKGISLSMHFQGVGKYDRFVGGAEGGFAQWGETLRPYYPIWANGDVWTPENPDAKYPRVVGQAYWDEAGRGASSFWKRDGSYIRLKNLNIGYSIPYNLIRPLGLNNAQVFMNATNLFYISKIGEFHDPEQANADTYPLMRTFTFGVNISF